MALPPNVVPALKNIPKGQDEVQIQLNPAANADLGPFSVGFTGKAKFQNKEFTVTSQPVDLELTVPQQSPPKVKISIMKKS